MNQSSRQKKYPLVSVVMACHNARPWISETVQSILNQDYSPFELIIVDDASADGTLYFLNSIRDRRVRVHTNKKNLGLSATRNEGLRLACGEYINFFDDDDVMLPGAIRKRARFLNKHKKFQVAFGYTQQIIGKNSRILKRYDRTGAFPAQGHFEEYKRGLQFFRLYKTIDFEIMQRFSQPPLHSLNNLLLRRNVIEKIGLFRRSLKVMNDSDYMFRLARASSFHFVDVPVKLYRFHGKNMSCRSSKKLLSHERRIIKKSLYKIETENEVH